MRVNVHVIPRSKHVEVKRINEESLRVKVLSPPVNGQANHELMAILSRYYSKPKSAIRIRSGLRSRNKVIEVED
ncbi:MAG: DUF167 domain-containing protein [candidate division WOR-3 bacterium]